MECEHWGHYHRSPHIPKNHESMKSETPRIRSWESTVASDVAFQWRAKMMGEYMSHETYCWWKKSCGFLRMIHRKLYIPGGAGFLSSTVSCESCCMRGDLIKRITWLKLGMPAPPVFSVFNLFIQRSWKPTWPFQRWCSFSGGKNS